MIGKVIGINLLILFVYTILINAVVVSGEHSHRSIRISLLLMDKIGLHTIINFVLSIVFFIIKRNDLGKAFLLSTAVVLIVGFSSCYGNSILY